MGQRHKRRAREILVQRDTAALEAWAGATRNALRVVFSLTYDDDELIQWRAIEAAGRCAAVLAEPSPEKIKVFLRGLFWLMNDESGGLGWHAPETIGEILYRVPQLIESYGSLVPQYLDEEPFEAGAHFALARLSDRKPSLIESAATRLTGSLDDPDPVCRAWAAMALETLGDGPWSDRCQALAGDSAAIRLYSFCTGDWVVRSVGQLVERGLSEVFE